MKGCEKMGKKDKELDVTDPRARACPTCIEWGNIDPKEFPCARVQGMVYRKRPRVGCGKWMAAE